MTKFDMLEKMKQCPLCLRRWHILEENGKIGKAYFFCNWCKIILWVQDPFIGHYEEFEAVPCPACREPKMRMFCRADGYIKFYCPKCKTTIENEDPDLKKTVIELARSKK